MPISRPVLLALLAALLAMATFYAASGAQRASSEPETASFAPEPEPEPEPERAPAPAPAPKPEAPAPQRGASKQQAAGEDVKQQPTAREDAKPEQAAANRREARRQRGQRGERAEKRRRAERRPAPLPPELRVDGLPRPVARALAAKRTIVLFFRQAAADDSATAAALAGARKVKGVAVFSAPIERLARYSAVISGLGVAQAPAIAIVGRDRQAQLVEGFVDAGTLRQLVMDAR